MVTLLSQCCLQHYVLALLPQQLKSFKQTECLESHPRAVSHNMRLQGSSPLALSGGCDASGTGV